MIRGLGCDVCAIERMGRILDNTRFLERYFTEGERAYIAARSRAAETAAGLFAAKEALVKALGIGIGPLSLIDAEIGHDEKGAPYYILNEKVWAALQKKGASAAFLSISHDGGVAMAVPILEGET